MRLLGRRSGLLFADTAESPAARAVRYGLVAAWAGADVSDSFGSNTLTNNNVTTFTAGKVGNAFTLVAASSQSLSIADNAPLSSGDISLWESAWVKLGNMTAVRTITAKWENTGNQREFQWYFDSSTVRFRLNYSNNGTATASSEAVGDVLGAPVTATWYHVFWFHDPVANLIGMIINGVAQTPISYSSGLFDGTSAYAIGTRNLGAGGANFMDGQVDEVCHGANVPGGFATTPALEIAQFLYNSGAGRTYPAGWT